MILEFLLSVRAQRRGLTVPHQQPLRPAPAPREPGAGPLDSAPTRSPSLLLGVRCDRAEQFVVNANQFVEFRLNRRLAGPLRQRCMLV